MAASASPSTQPDLVRFTFGDRELVGRVVDAEWDARFNDPAFLYTVDVDGIEYPVRQSSVEVVETW